MKLFQGTWVGMDLDTNRMQVSGWTDAGTLLWLLASLVYTAAGSIILYDPFLASLELSFTRVTAASAEALRALLPRCQISCEFSPVGG